MSIATLPEDSDGETDSASASAAWDPGVRTLLQSITLVDRDWMGIQPFFEREVPDLDGAQAYIDATYAAYPALIRQSRLAIDIIRTARKGDQPDLSSLRAVNLKNLLNFLIMVGEIDTLKVLLPICEKQFSLNRIRELNTMVTAPGETLGPLRVLDKPWLDWQIFGTGAATTVILMSGAVGKFGMETNVLLPWLTDLPCNVILARDRRRSLYLRGIGSLGIDKAATIAAMRQELDRIGTKRLVMAGNSGGVYGALHYGCLLDADQVVCFAGPTTLELGLEESEDRPVYDIIAKAVEAGTLTTPDIIADLRKTGLDVRYFHGADNEFDSRQAAMLKDLPHARVEPVSDWSGHFVQGELARRGLFKSIWRDAITGGAGNG